MRSLVLAAILTLLLLAPPAVAEVDEQALKVLYDKQLDRSVAVVLYDKQYGTGWWIADTYLVTAAHVVENNPSASVVVTHGSYTSTGMVVALDKKADIAVISVNTPMPDARVLPLCTSVEKGQEVLVVGYPYEMVIVAGGIKKASNNPRAAFGTIAWVGSGDKKWLAEVQATTDQGNSGGPVIDADSDCSVGLVTFALKGNAGVLYYLTNIHALAPLLDANGIPYSTKTNQAGIEPVLPGGGDAYKYAALGAGAMLILVLLAMFASGKRRILAAMPLVLVAAIAAAPAVAQTPLVVTDDDAAEPHGVLKPGYYLLATMSWKVEASVFKQEKEVWDSELIVGPVYIKAGLYKDAPGLKSYYAGIWVTNTYSNVPFNQQLLEPGGSGGFKNIKKYSDTAQESYQVKVSFTCDKKLRVYVNGIPIYTATFTSTTAQVSYDDETKVKTGGSGCGGWSGGGNDPLEDAPTPGGEKTLLYAAVGAGAIVIAMAAVLLTASNRARRAILPLLATPLFLIIILGMLMAMSFTLVGSNWKAAIAGAGILLLGLFILTGWRPTRAGNGGRGTR